MRWAVGQQPLTLAIEAAWNASRRSGGTEQAETCPQLVQGCRVLRPRQTIGKFCGRWHWPGPIGGGRLGSTAVHLRTARDDQLGERVEIG